MSVQLVTLELQPQQLMAIANLVDKTVKFARMANNVFNVRIISICTQIQIMQLFV